MFVCRGPTEKLNPVYTIQPDTTGLTTGCIHDTAVCQTGCQTGLTTGCIVYANIYPVVKPFDNRFDNRLYHVNGALATEEKVVVTMLQCYNVNVPLLKTRPADYNKCAKTVKV